MIIIILIISLILLTSIFIIKILYFRKEKYIIIDDKYNVKAGLSHHLSNLYSFLNLSKQLGKIPILPKFYLTGLHNNNKEIRADFTKYLEIPSNILKELPKDVHKNDIEIYLPKNKLIRFDNYYIKNNPKKYYTKFIWNKNIYKKAQNVLENLETPIVCMHIRRGDMIKVKKKLIHDTSINNILGVLNKIKKEKKFKTVYIMTNEKDKKYFDILKRKFNIKLFEDFPELKRIENDDNYELFCIEKCILELSDIRVSTFKTDNIYYQYYLSNESGFQ